MMARRVAPAVVILCMVALAVALRAQPRQHSLALHRTPSVVLQGEEALREHERRLRDEPSNRQVRGASIPLSGGVLRVGAYYTTLSAGTPAQNYQLLVDTGSSNTAIPGLGCNSCSNGTVYKSSSARAQPFNSTFCAKCAPTGDACNQCVFGPPYAYASTGNCGFGITYGGGSSGIEGYYVTDTACLGGLCSNSVAIGLMQREYPPGTLTSGPFDGIMGLASDFNACNPTCVPTILDSLGIDLFSLCLTPSSGGVLDLGLIDSAKAAAPIQYTPFEVDRWYNLVVQDIRVGGISIGLSTFIYRTTNDVIGAFIDSGTSTILLNGMIYSGFKDTYQKNYCNLKGVCTADNIFDGHCMRKTALDPISSYPNFTVVVAGTQPGSTVALDLPANNYLVEVAGEVCLGIQGPQVGVGMVLGDLFMQNFYIVHDLHNKQLGFAPLKAGTCK